MGKERSPSRKRFSLLRPGTAEQFERYFDLRWRVLRQPWSQPRGSERDDHEEGAFHLMAVDEEGVPWAVGRLHVESQGCGRIRYMAVEERGRGAGLGRMVLEGLENEARNRGLARMILNARESVVGFYLRAGYLVTGEGPLLFGEIRHSIMEKSLV